MLHLKPFGKTFNEEFIKSPFSERVKIKIIISVVTTSGNIDFNFTEKSQCFIGKHIRNTESFSRRSYYRMQRSSVATIKL